MKSGIVARLLSVMALSTGVVYAEDMVSGVKAPKATSSLPRASAKPQVLPKLAESPERDNLNHFKELPFDEGIDSDDKAVERTLPDAPVEPLASRPESVGVSPLTPSETPTPLAPAEESATAPEPQAPRASVSPQAQTTCAFGDLAIGRLPADIMGRIEEAAKKSIFLQESTGRKAGLDMLNAQLASVNASHAMKNAVEERKITEKLRDITQRLSDLLIKSEEECRKELTAIAEELKTIEETVASDSGGNGALLYGSQPITSPEAGAATSPTASEGDDSSATPPSIASTAAPKSSDGGDNDDDSSAVPSGDKAPPASPEPSDNGDSATASSNPADGGDNDDGGDENDGAPTAGGDGSTAAA